MAGEVGVSILSDYPCHLGEGPVYDPDTDTLFWFDILGRKLLEKRLGGMETVIRDLPEMMSALAIINEGNQLLVGESGLSIRDVKTGAITPYFAIEGDNPATRSNDARVHPCGALWLSTMGKKAERGAGSIYWFFKGEFRTLVPDISIPNSICFSPDGAAAYYTDTAVNLLYRVACDPETGLPAGERRVFFDHGGRQGGLDGSVVDAEGVLWNARWGASSIDAYSPDGRLVRSIALPTGQPSCPAFVGANADRLAVTTAWEHMDEAARQADRHAGRTLLLDLPVQGRFEPRVLI
ncbi:sugar lactone lactonase YvrE [Pseudaminobacter salicylatoxidans]|uniref:Sugar lactone lactonase YvrE n=1 Tax=Pseudaminobacter salicylatoxidans TaxID=93369 RepID=A0A316C8T6_PSESE|nr:SMP-30/gluconolactonase/LRE family protein [Pseudaminobacter salicylatoxidans]PWJ74442.1 sugar lactone lactonase YvrE [Pseudaminobacter salicylatoxidans]